MKILIIQLARLGDIYMSWPAMRAVRRQHPSAEIHLLTRPRFEGAVEGLTAIDRHLSMPSGSILAPLVQETADLDASLQNLSEFLNPLKSESYDWIINLTFSPFSSYLTHALSHEATKVSGYTRFADGYFNPADDMSAYFYAQVGVDKPNRVHIADIFAAMLNIDYVEADWAAPVIQKTEHNLPESYLVVHVGASEKHKSLPASAWAEALQQIAKRRPNTAVVLIGSAAEKIYSHEIISGVQDLRIFDFVGRTKISDLFSIIKGAELLIGCDSAPIHMASLTDTPTLNVSMGAVNFWETGPKASLSFILRSTESQVLTGSKVGNVVCNLLDGVMDSELIVRTAGLASYAKEDESLVEAFQWSLIQALYLGASYPMAERIEVIQGAMKLDEVNSFILEQLALIPQIGLQRVAPLIERGEEIIKTISRIVPELSPLINWYHAEKIRIAPGDQEEVRIATLNVHERFRQQLRVYIPQEENQVEEMCDGTL